MSQEFKSALEQEVCIERGKHYVKRFSRDAHTQIGLDETQAASRAVRTDASSDVTEEMRRASAAEAWGGSPPGQGVPTEADAPQSPSAQDAPQPGKLPDLTQFKD